MSLESKIDTYKINPQKLTELSPLLKDILHASHNMLFASDTPRSKAKKRMKRRINTVKNFDKVFYFLPIAYFMACFAYALVMHFLLV